MTKQKNNKKNKHLSLKLDLPVLTLYSIIIFDVFYFILFDNLLNSNNHISLDAYGNSTYINEFTKEAIDSTNWILFNYFIWGALLLINIVAVYLLFRYYKSRPIH